MVLIWRKYLIGSLKNNFDFVPKKSSKNIPKKYLVKSHKQIIKQQKTDGLTTCFFVFNYL